MRLLGATRYDGASDSIVLTDKGMYCWVLMMAEFFNAVNMVRDAMRLQIRAELDDLKDSVAPGPATEAMPTGQSR